MELEVQQDYSFANPYIGPGESILWRGCPGKGHLFTGSDVLMIPFSILWCGFAIFWEASVLSAGAPLLFKLWGIPFVCVGLYITVGRFFHMAWMRKRTAYVITNKKIIRARGNRIDMIEGRNMPPVQISAFRDGSGTIRIGFPTYYRRRNSVSWNGTDSSVFSLENIPEVARVERIIASMER